jgi:ABC-type polysaccharide/polyol phosphate transport system ATPase subunit
MLDLNTLLFAETLQVGVIGVYGMAGVGKTSLLKIIYNIYKVSDL